MARSLSLALLVALLVPAVPAAAQEPDETPKDAVTPDAADDVKLYAAPTLGVPPQGAPPTATADAVDLRMLTIGQETEANFKITLATKALAPDNVPGPVRVVNFDFEQVRYRISLGFNRGGNSNQGALQAYDDGVDRYRIVAFVETKVDAASNAVTFTIPRELVVNSHHVPARYGDELTNVSATATHYLLVTAFLPTGDPTGGMYLEDRLPDEGSGTPFGFVKGRVGSEDVSLVSPEPIRVSNGEATTVVYKVVVINQGTGEATYQLEARDVPAGWSVRVPSLLKVAPQEELAFPVILAVPFSHEHGKTATFELYAQSVGGGNSWSSIRLGVFWTKTPQPAGHHPEMWLHSAPSEANTAFGPFGLLFPFRSAWFNPLETDPEPDTDDKPVPAFFNNEILRFVFTGSHPVPPGNRWTTEWLLPLSPGLLIGLDFDAERQGVLEDLRIKHGMPAPEAQVAAQLLYCDPEQATNGCTGAGGGGGGGRWAVIADGESAKTSADKDQVVGYRIPLTVKPEADLLPYKRGANIALRLTLITNVPANTVGVEPRPELVVKHDSGRAKLTLPLIEYHDPVDQAFEAIGTLQLKSLVPFEKPVNPGRSALFRFYLNNTGTNAEEVQLELHGENQAWSRVEGPTRFVLPPSGSQLIQLLVTVPASEVEGSYADLFLVAQSLRDPTVVAATRLKAKVVQSMDIPDEASLVAQRAHADTPGPELLALALAVAAAAWAGRRRRW